MCTIYYTIPIFNIFLLCRLHRQPKHLLDFLLAELGTSGSVDGNSQLIIKGRFQQKQIENVLRRYIKEYVTCHTCRSPETILQKDTRLFFLQCETCGSRCSVASIKSGFQVNLSILDVYQTQNCFIEPNNLLKINTIQDLLFLFIRLVKSYSCNNVINIFKYPLINVWYKFYNI